MSGAGASFAAGILHVLGQNHANPGQSGPPSGVVNASGTSIKPSPGTSAPTTPAAPSAPAADPGSGGKGKVTIVNRIDQEIAAQKKADMQNLLNKQSQAGASQRSAIDAIRAAMSANSGMGGTILSGSSGAAPATIQGKTLLGI